MTASETLLAQILGKLEALQVAALRALALAAERLLDGCRLAFLELQDLDFGRDFNLPSVSGEERKGREEGEERGRERGRGEGERGEEREEREERRGRREGGYPCIELKLRICEDFLDEFHYIISICAYCDRLLEICRSKS